MALEEQAAASRGYVPRETEAPFRVFGEGLEPTALEQLRNACRLPVSVAGALMPDAHQGYGLPIGGVLATREAVIPYAVGADIACRMRLSVLDLGPEALATVVGPTLKRFAHDYPDVSLDVASEDDTRGDLVAGRFDAGIHLGEFLQRDMVAVKVTPEQRAAVVAAPAYFDSHPKPKTPRDLTTHRCLRYRMGSNGPVYRWEFEKRGKPVTVSVAGPLTVNDVEFMIRAALDGVGLAYTLEEYVAEYVARGELVRVLEDWCPPFDGYFLYYPSRRHQPPALQALVNALRI